MLLKVMSAAEAAAEFGLSEEEAQRLKAGVVARRRQSLTSAQRSLVNKRQVARPSTMLTAKQCQFSCAKAQPKRWPA
jgi:hypothetical protein